MAATDEDLVADLIAAHTDAENLTALLAQTRNRRREIAAQLHAAGYSYRWLGQQIGVSPQAVESFVKYHQRRTTKP